MQTKAAARPRPLRPVSQAAKSLDSIACSLMDVTSADRHLESIDHSLRNLVDVLREISETLNRPRSDFQ